MKLLKIINISKLTLIIIIIICSLTYTKSVDKFTNIPDTLTNGYNIMNTKRFTTFDNQQRLDNISNRINKLLNDIQISYKLNSQTMENALQFY